MVDAVGPETYTFLDLVRLIAESIGSRSRIVPAPGWVAMLIARLIGCVTRDVVLTRDELTGLMANLLVSKAPPTGRTRLSDWLKRHADTVGRGYASELGRHFAGGR